MTTWHASPDDLRRYAAGNAGFVAGSSVEAHLEGCARCRAAITATMRELTQARQDAVWMGVIDRVDRPVHAPLARVLTRCGMPEPWAIVATATLGMTTAWLVLQVVLVAGAVILSNLGAGANAGAPFVLAAPLFPMAAVVAAYHRVADPAPEVSAAAPLAGARLALVRIVASICTSTVTLMLGSLALGAHWDRFAWVLPTAAAVAVLLAATTVVGVARAVAAVASMWIVLWGYVLFFSATLHSNAARVFAVVTGPAQLAWLAATLVAATVVVLRRDSFDVSLELRREQR